LSGVGRGDLTNEEWARLMPYLPANGDRGGQWRDHRRVLIGIRFRERTGVPWRDLPTRHGKWKTVYERHRRWSADGTWDRILKAVQAQADADGRLDWSQVSVDSTTCRAHQPPAFDRAAYKRRNEVERLINRLKGFRAVATRCARSWWAAATTCWSFRPTTKWSGGAR
jgi:transposase